MNEESRQFDFRFAAMDTALVNTGVAVYYFNSLDGTFKLKCTATIKTHNSLQGTDSRVCCLIDQFKEFVEKYDLNAVVSEEPSVIYMPKFCSDSVIAGRVHDLIKVSAACYGLFGWCYSHGIYCRLVLPVTWQSKLDVPVAKDGHNKTRSILAANKVLKLFGFQPLSIQKKQVEQASHVADAVNIGFHTIKAFSNKEWNLPE